MRWRDGQEVGVAAWIEEAVDDLRAARCRQIDGQALLAERGLDRLQEPRQVDVLRIDLVDDHEPAEFAFGRPLHHAGGDHRDAGLCAYHHRRGLHCVERSDGRTDEVRKARGIDQVHPRALSF